MKKLFTLLAFLALALGANAKEIVDAEVDFSKYGDISEWGFPNSWGGSDAAKARLSIKDGCLHFESTEATDPSWDCQFFPIGGVNAEVDVTYTLHFKIKGDHAGNVSMLGFGQTPYGQFAITTDWVEGTVDYVATSADGNILMQCGDWVGSWDIAYLKITHEGKEERPVEWTELLTNGDAETPWGDLADVKFDDMEKNYTICAWSKEKGHNVDTEAENNPWNPFPAPIVDDPDKAGNHVFLVDGQIADTEGDPSAWDNQFWIQAPRRIKPGEQVKVHFRYKASEAAKTNTQIHHQKPSDYMHYVGIGDVNFTTEWQEVDQIVSWPTGGDDQGWSIAFNLNPENKNAIKFYFDDLSICEMKLDKGFFVAAANTTTGLEYDLDNAVELTTDDDVISATVGTAGKKDTWVNEVMISTVRGNNGAFKAATLKPSGVIDGTADTWLPYAEGSNAKIQLPAAGVWKISIDTNDKLVNFFQVEGDAIAVKDPVDIVTNATEVTVKGQERDFIKDDDHPDGTGQTWDNQFFIIANRNLAAGEVTHISFKYKRSNYAGTADVTSGTQSHNGPGQYIHWAAIGSFTFTDEWQEFDADFTIPKECDGSEGDGFMKEFKSIAFNMAEVKEACDYELKDFKWYIKNDGDAEGKTMENLIDAEGSKNFFVKEGANTNPYEFGTDPSGIINVKEDAVKNDGAIYNLAGQRVSKDYKGIVVKNGKKYIVK